MARTVAAASPSYSLQTFFCNPDPHSVYDLKGLLGRGQPVIINGAALNCPRSCSQLSAEQLSIVRGAALKAAFNPP